jgi:AcrR family transcriptional regulator
MGKSKSTRETILERAVADASLRGLNALTIGTLAAELDMSKSGLFAHFGSKEALQRATVQETIRLFTDQCVLPALALPPGKTQIRSLFRNWIAWSLDEQRPGGCPMAGAAFDMDGQPGEVRDLVADGFRRWAAALKDVIEKAKRVDLDPNVDADTLILQIFGLYFSHHLYRWLLDDRTATERTFAAFENVLSGV